VSMNGTPPVRPTTLQQPATDTRASALGSATDRVMFDPLLCGHELMVNMVIRGVVGLTNVYENRKASRPEPTNEPSKLELMYKNKPRVVNLAWRVLSETATPNFRPIIGGSKTTIKNYFDFKKYLRGESMNPESIKWTAIGASAAGVLHALTFYPGSTAQTFLDRLQPLTNSVAGRANPRVVPFLGDHKGLIKILMLMAAGSLSKEFTKNDSVYRLKIPQNEGSQKLLNKKDKANSDSVLRDHACVFTVAVLILLPFSKQKIGPALLKLVQNPSERFRSFTTQCVPDVVGLGTGLWAANRLGRAGAQSAWDAVTVAPHNSR
jgi:hypothetical protein